MTEENGIRIPKGMLAIVGGVLMVGGAIWTAATTLVTKPDFNALQGNVSSLSQQQSALAQKIADVEREVDRFFGGTGPAAKKSSYFDLNSAVLVEVADQSRDANRRMEAQSYSKQRPVAVPQWFILRHKLEPETGGSYLLRGADGLLYSVDDVIAGMIADERR